MGITTLLAVTAQAQQSSPLEITAPADGTVIAPGQTITVVVTPAPGVSFADGISVRGAGPIGDSGPLVNSPFEFSLTVPSDAPSGRYEITALSSPGSACPMTSPSITLGVERSDTPTVISSESAEMRLESVGQQLPLRITGTFADGTTTDLTRSSNMTYRSTDPTVATVDESGIVAAVGAGTSFVVASYGRSPSAAVRIVVLPPILTLSPTHLAFSDQLVGSSSAPQTITVINSRSEPLTIMNVAATEDFAETDDCVSSSPLPVGGGCSIDVRFLPTRSGQRKGNVTIGNVANVAPPSVSLMGHGLPSQTNPPPTANAGTNKSADTPFGIRTAPILGN